MNSFGIKFLIVAAWLGCGTLAAWGQTGRIALASHAGRMGEVDGGNFGIIPSRIGEGETDSLVCLNDTLMVRYGRYRSAPYGAGHEALKNAPWKQNQEQIQYYFNPYQRQSWEEAVGALRRNNPQAKLVGFDKQLQKHRSKKPAGRSQASPRRPFQYSYWRGLATVAALGAVGWLLGRKSKTA